jgi:predicted type IV restriction endonuclease
MDVKTAVELSDGVTALQHLIAEQTGDLDRNEADTRFHIVDCLLQGVLGWSRDEFRLETAEGRTFSDCELGTPLQMIWEAKREGRAFSVPLRSKRGLVHDIASISAASEEARNAIAQVNRYCLDRGAEIAVATNGH